MFTFIKQVLLVLLIFSESLARDRTKCMSLNNGPSMVRLTLIDLNPVELKHYAYMISLDKCSGSCNVLSPEICVPKKNKTNVKAFNMKTCKNEAKTITKHTSCDCKCKFNNTTYNANEKSNNKTC